MYEGKTSTLFRKYAVPQMIGLLFNSVYLIVDGIFIGNRLGRDSMAAAAISVPFIEILLSIAMAVASGAGIMISNYLGRQERKAANQIFNVATWVLGGISILIVLFGNIFLHPLANLLGSTPQIHKEAVKYLWYIITFSPFLLFSFLLGGLARNDGRPKLAMFALAFGSISNIVLDYVFMYPLNMGISGAALATALGPIFSVLILLPHFLRKKGDLHFTKVQVYKRTIHQIFVFGFPSFIMEFTIGIITFIYNFAIIKYGYGEIGLAAYLVIGYLMLIILTIFLGMAEGLQPVFSYFTGTGETKKNRDMLSFATKIFLGIGVISYIIIVFFSRDFFSLFTPGDIELISFAEEKSLLYFSGFFLAGFNILMISFWQSTQVTRWAMSVSLMRSLVVPPILIFLLPIIFGNESIWICHSLGEAITACVAFSMLIAANRKRKIKDIRVSKHYNG
ncbi:MATE family efflux transporter [Tissierella carlieri]|uniref:Multidrug export protein MepA n=1 Tax=Tissierella carlieri TaxID=689904 RepID=A0ABT1S700_9FIRM|nr:MATE family efflux transporter [Tissierella carlieri]MCQ4922248.1 MATE family efflux transporter [Tissierella carlieri]